MGSRLVRDSLSKELSHPALLGSAATRPWDIHMGQVAGMFLFTLIAMCHHSTHLFFPLQSWMKGNMAAESVLSYGKFHHDMVKRV